MKAKKQYFPFIDWSEAECTKSELVPARTRPGALPAITKISIKKPKLAKVSVDVPSDVPIEVTDTSDMTAVLRFLGLS